MEKPPFPMRINKYLAWKKLATRREADALIKKGGVFINGKQAVLGDKVNHRDEVEVKSPKRHYRYFAFNKPKNVITHSPQHGEVDIKSSISIKGVFPVGRLDKDSHGLIILTDDGRISDRLLNPNYEHEKEYRVTVTKNLRPSFRKYMESGVVIGDYETRKSKVKILGPRTFAIFLTEGKKHQIRRMVDALHNTVAELERIRVMNIKLGSLKPGQYRPIEENELAVFLKSLGF